MLLLLLLVHNITHILFHLVVVVGSIQVDGITTTATVGSSMATRRSTAHIHVWRAGCVVVSCIQRTAASFPCRI